MDKECHRILFGFVKVRRFDDEAVDIVAEDSSEFEILNLRRGKRLFVFWFWEKRSEVVAFGWVVEEWSWGRHDG